MTLIWIARSSGLLAVRVAVAADLYGVPTDRPGGENSTVLLSDRAGLRVPGVVPHGLVAGKGADPMAVQMLGGDPESAGGVEIGDIVAGLCHCRVLGLVGLVPPVGAGHAGAVRPAEVLVRRCLENHQCGEERLGGARSFDTTCFLRGDWDFQLMSSPSPPPSMDLSSGGAVWCR